MRIFETNFARPDCAQRGLGSRCFACSKDGLFQPAIQR